jgi:hypothetical protein
VNTEDMVALATQFAELSAQIQGDGQPEGGWRRVGELAVQHVEGCRWVSVTDVVSGRGGRSLLVSDPVAGWVDALQYEVAEGPCLQSATEGDSVLSADLAHEVRWPGFSARAAAESPVRSVLAIRLPARDSAAMNFYADTVDAFGDQAFAAASIVAALAASLITLGEVAEQSLNLKDALGSNRQIGMAMGVLMAHHKVTQDEAFTLLRVASQNLHRKLRDIAVEVTETGALPDLPNRSTALRDVPGGGGSSR